MGYLYEIKGYKYNSSKYNLYIIETDSESGTKSRSYPCINIKPKILTMCPVSFKIMKNRIIRTSLLQCTVLHSKVNIPNMIGIMLVLGARVFIYYYSFPSRITLGASLMVEIVGSNLWYRILIIISMCKMICYLLKNRLQISIRAHLG